MLILHVDSITILSAQTCAREAEYIFSLGICQRLAAAADSCAWPVVLNLSATTSVLVTAVIYGRLTRSVPMALIPKYSAPEVTTVWRYINSLYYYYYYYYIDSMCVSADPLYSLLLSTINLLSIDFVRITNCFYVLNCLCSFLSAPSPRCL